MTSIKGLLLGSAAGLIAVASAQAADLPVKAKPVEYVKVCSQYGAGFFYVPGTETCLKIGMYLRVDHMYGGTNAYSMTTAGARQTRTDTNQYAYRARINLTTDWRTQTDYGVLRAYAAIIGQQSTGENATGAVGILRAFIQFAGFTVGHAVSYYDFFNGADYGYVVPVWIGGTGVNGTDLVAYTWQLGNGWSVSIDAEDGGAGGTGGQNQPAGAGRPKIVVNASTAGIFAFPGAAPNGTANNQMGQNFPDFAGNIRVDQAWGSAQIAAAVHDNSPGYFTSFAPFPAGSGAAAANQVFGHPQNKFGWAVMGGFKILNFLQPKDVLEFQIDYGKGAANYIGNFYQTNAMFGSGNSLGVGWATDAVFANGTGIEQTEAWGFAAAYQHWWNAQWRTAVVGGYTQYNYTDTAKALLCAGYFGAAGTSNPFPIAGNVGGAVIAGANCNPDHSLWSASTRTAWNPHPTLEIGLDLIWAHLNTGFKGLANVGAAVGARPAGIYKIEDQDTFMGVMRFQKTILP